MNYFEKGKIDNPLNIKRITGDFPTTQSSSKNVIIILALTLSMAYTINKVWAFALGYLKSPVLTIIVMAIVYLSIFLKAASVTVLEEKKHKKAYRDLLDNRLSDISVIWEIQDIKEEEVLGNNISYIDYIDGSRTTLLKCVPGSVMALDDDFPKYHYSSVEEGMKYIDDLGYDWDLYLVEEPANEEGPLNYYYEQLKNYSDEDYISIFTEQLDVIAHTSDLRSMIHVSYIEITARGKHKHNMLKNIVSLPEVIGTNTIFKSIELLSTKAEMDAWIADQSSVTMFDRDDLIMNKYKETFNLGVTTVLAALSETGSIIRQFNKDFDVRKMVRKDSIDINKTPTKRLTGNKETIGKESNKLSKPTDKPIGRIGLSNEELINLSDSKDKTFIELMYSKDKVILGSGKQKIK